MLKKSKNSSVTKTRQIAIRWNIAAQHHLRPVEDLARCPIDKLAGPPADFLNAALVGLLENRTSPKRSFSTQSALSRSSGRDRALPVCDRNGHSSRLGSDLRRGGFASQSPKVIKSIRPADVSPERCHQCMPAFGQSNDGRPFLAYRVGLPPAFYTSRAALVMNVRRPECDEQPRRPRSR